MRNAQGKLVNNPYYDAARAATGGTDWSGVGGDLTSIAFQVAVDVFTGWGLTKIAGEEIADGVTAITTTPNSAVGATAEMGLDRKCAR